MLTTIREMKALARGRREDRAYRPVMCPSVGDRVCYVGPLGTNGSDASLNGRIDVVGHAGTALVRWPGMPLPDVHGQPLPGESAARWCSVTNLRYPPTV